MTDPKGGGSSSNAHIEQKRGARAYATGVATETAAMKVELS